MTTRFLLLLGVLDCALSCGGVGGGPIAPIAPTQSRSEVDALVASATADTSGQEIQRAPEISVTALLFALRQVSPHYSLWPRGVVTRHQ